MECGSRPVCGGEREVKASGSSMARGRCKQVREHNNSQQSHNPSYVGCGARECAYSVIGYEVPFFSREAKGLLLSGVEC